MGSHWKLKPNICMSGQVVHRNTVLSNHNLWQIKAHILCYSLQEWTFLLLPSLSFFVKKLELTNIRLRLVRYNFKGQTSICSSSTFSSLHQAFKFQSKSCYFLLQFRGLSDLRLWYAPRGNAFTCNISSFLQYFRVLCFQWKKHGGYFFLKHSYVYYLCNLSYPCWEFDWISWF